jgi:hypothetical protein
MARGADAMTYPVLRVETSYRNNSDWPRFRCFQCNKLRCTWLQDYCYICRKERG